MPTSDVCEAVKKATVAIIATYENALPQRPFTIIGSGFCIDAEGIVITCDHVFKGFFYPGQGNAVPGGPFRMMAPHAMFFGGVEGKEIVMHSVGIHNAVTINGFDLCAMKLSKYDAYPNGYPTLPIADYGELHEMMEIATCGFPLGEVLHEQRGTVTSSFTKGMISSIIPCPSSKLYAGEAPSESAICQILTSPDPKWLEDVTMLHAGQFPCGSSFGEGQQ